MHLDQEVIRRQLRRIEPGLARLPLRHLATGWDNEVYRLGEALLVRAPRRALAQRLAVNEHRWLPVLAHSSGLQLPEPLYFGTPDEIYPFTLSVCRYLPGRSAVELPREARDGYADELARYLRDIHQPAPGDAPRSTLRGLPLPELDSRVRRRLAGLQGSPGRAAARIWEDALAAPAYHGPAAWLHGDPHPHNTIVTTGPGTAGHLAGLVDFGDMCAGDPASDLGMLWLHFTAAARQRALGLLGAQAGGAAWRRARGWALHYALILASLPPGDPLGLLGRDTLRAMLDEDEPGSGP